MDMAKLRWMTQMLGNCTTAAYADQQEPHGASGGIFARLPASTCAPSTGISYDERTQGTLQLFRTKKQVDAAGQGHRRAESRRRAVRGAGRRRLCRAPNRALRQFIDKIAGGLRLPGDETGDCFKFTNCAGGLWPRRRA